MTTMTPAEKPVVELAILEPLGIDRPRHPATLGVPFPQGLIRSSDDLRLTRDQTPLPLQTRTMLCWPDGSVKWALIDFQTDLTSGEEAHCQLAGGRGEPAECESPVEIHQGRSDVVLRTGDLEVTVALDAPLPFASARFAGADVLGRESIASSMVIDKTVYRLRAVTQPVVEESGPLRVVVRVDGKAVTEDGQEGFDVTSRITVNAGHSTVGVFLTLTNRIPRPLVHLGSWDLQLRPILGDIADEFIVSHTATGHRKVFVDRLVDGRRTFRVDVQAMDFEPWLPATHDMQDEQTPEQPASACPFYTILPGDNGEAESRRPGADWHTLVPGAAVVGSNTTTMTVACRHPWHNAPKEVTIANGSISLGLYPSWADPLEWHRGVARTHELMIDFRAGPPDADERLAFACGFEKRPAPQVATRNWMVDTGVFGPVFRYQPERYPFWEYIMRSAAKENVFSIESRSEMGFSFLNYGDYWSPRRGGQWYNNEMDKGYGLILQMIRTGYAPLMEAIEPVIHHQIDVDTIHDAEEDWWIGGQRYHFAKHGAMRGPALCHEWIDGPLFFGLLTGYRRAEEVALARAEHLCRAIERGAHRQKTLARVAGYPLMALSRMHENYGNARYLKSCELILDWLDQWHREEGGFFYVAYTPPGTAKVATGLCDGILLCALMRHYAVTGSERSWEHLKRLADDDIGVNGLFTPEGFSLKNNNPFRDYYEPEPDFFFEPLVYLSQETGDGRYADVAYNDMQRVFAQRQMLSGAPQDAHFYRYWLPFLARADALGILTDPKPF